MINRTKVKESTQIKPGDNGDVLVMKDNAPEWSTPSDADLAKASDTDAKLDEKQDKLVAGDNIHIVGNTISADGKPTPIAIGTVTSGEVPMVSNSGTDTDVVLNFVLPKGDKGDPGKDGTQVNIIAPLVVDTAPVANRPDYNLAIGNGAVANTGLAQLAVGASATCSSVYSTAVGSGATAKGEATTAVGYSAKANSTGGNTEGATVVGFGALTSPSSKGGIAIGGNSFVVEDFGTAVGVSATASASESVAIGHNSYTTRDHEVSVGMAHGVSRPDNAFTRVISNVTDPTEAQDAATKNYVDTKISEIPAGTVVNSILPLTVETPPDEGDNTGNILFGNNVHCNGSGVRGGVGVGVNVVVGGDSVAIGNNAITSYGAIAIGLRSYADGYSSNTGCIALGENAIAKAPAAVAIGANSSVTRPSGGNARYSVALGPYSTATEEGVVSVGSGVTTLTLSDDMTEEEQAIARLASDVPTRRIINVTDPRGAQDAATKNYVDTQLEPINTKLQYVPENTNQILSQIETNAEKAQAAAEAAQTTAESKANQSDLTALQTTVTQQAETIAQLQQTITQLQATINNLTLETERI